MTPHSPLFGHPNPYQPIPNPATFTTILFILKKHIVPHGRIPNTTTHLHPHTPIQTYTQIYTHSGYTFSPPYQTHPTILGTTENIMEHQEML